MNIIHHQIELGERLRAMVFGAIKEKPATLDQLCATFGMHKQAMRKHVRRLKSPAHKRIHVSGHELVKGKGAAIYSAGNLPDVVFVSTPPVKAERRRAPREPMPVTAVAPQSWFASLT